MKTIKRLLVAQEKNLTAQVGKESILVFNNGRDYLETKPIPLLIADAIMRDCTIHGFPVTMRVVTK